VHAVEDVMTVFVGVVVRDASYGSACSFFNRNKKRNVVNDRRGYLDFYERNYFSLLDLKKKLEKTFRSRS
jgi:hypothetical protein